MEGGERVKVEGRGVERAASAEIGVVVAVQGGEWLVVGLVPLVDGLPGWTYPLPYEAAVGAGNGAG